MSHLEENSVVLLISYFLICMWVWIHRLVHCRRRVCTPCISQMGINPSCPVGCMSLLQILNRNRENTKNMLNVQSTSKYFGAKEQIAAATFKHMLTHLVQFVQQNEQKGI
jgi:hypothetical protein